MRDKPGYARLTIYVHSTGTIAWWCASSSRDIHKSISRGGAGAGRERRRNHYL